MGQGTTAVRRDIERTRDDMSETIDAIAERTSPSRVLGRQRRRVTHWFRSIRERVMGTTEGLKTSAQEAVQSGAQTTQQSAGQLAETARELPGQARDQMRTQTQGSPLAAGLIAFGGGLLAAHLIPSSRVERRAASQVRETAEPALQDLKEAGSEVAGDLKSTAQHAAGDLKQTASASAQRVGDDAMSAADDVRRRATSATESVGDSARQASNEVRQ